MPRQRQENIIEPSPPPRAVNHATVISLCFSIAALEGYDIQSVGVAAPAMGRALHIAKDQLGYAGSISMLGLVIGAFFAGWIADRIGRKPVLIAAVIGFGIFSLATTLAVDGQTLMALRFGAGLGFGGAMPNLLAVAAEISAPQRRAATATTMFVGFPAGGALAALVTRLTGEAFDWRLIFIVGGVLPLILTPLALWLLPETRPAPDTRQPRNLHILMGAGAVRATLLLSLAMGFTLVVQYVMLSWLPTLALARGMSREGAALAAIYYNLAGVAGGLVLGRVVDRYGSRRPLASTYFGLVVVLLILAVGRGPQAVLLLSALAGFLLIGALFCVYAMSPYAYPASVRGTGTGAAVGLGRVGAIAGPALGGVLLAGGATAGQVVQAVVPIAIAAGMTAVLLALVAKPHTD